VILAREGEVVDMLWKSNPVEEAIRIEEIFTFFKIHHEKNYEFPGETHNFWEMVYVIKGSLCVSADEKIYNLSGGEVIFHKPMELHKFYIDDEYGADIVVITFNATGNLTEFFEGRVCRIDNDQQYIVESLIRYAEIRKNPKKSFFRNYVDTPEATPLYWSTVAGYAQMLMLSLAQSSSEPSVVKNADSSIFARAVKYMNDNIFENPTADDIAQSLNVSVSTLKRIFARYAGFGVHKYFLKLKLKYAMKLLEDGYSVTLVAEKLNFSSQGYFTRAFKRETGTLPSDYLI